MFIKNFGMLFFVFIIFVISLTAQTASDTTISGFLTKSISENKYSINGIEIKLPDDKKDSYSFYFEPYIGQEIKFRGKSINEKLMIGDDIWYGIDHKPTSQDYPQIIKTGTTIEDFIPKNWVILEKAVGDLNNDNQEDAVLAIRGNDLKFFRFSHDVRGKIQWLTNPITNVRHSGTDGNPRILVVLLKSADGYKLLLQNNSFLPISVFGIGESLSKVEINRGELNVKFNYGDPHWGFIEKNFSFNLVNSKLALTKYKTTKNLRADGSGIYDYDFQKKLVTITKPQTDEKEAVNTPIIKKLEFKNLLNLETITSFDEVENKISQVNQ